MIAKLPVAKISCMFRGQGVTKNKLGIFCNRGRVGITEGQFGIQPENENILSRAGISNFSKSWRKGSRHAENVALPSSEESDLTYSYFPHNPQTDPHQFSCRSKEDQQ